MKPLSRVAGGFSFLALASTVLYAQSAISARSGMVHYIEGKVFVGQQQVDSKFGQFPQVKENEALRTEEGRAEVLLTPGVFLRVGENTSFRMITNRLIDTRLEFLSGSLIVEADDILKDNSVTVVAKGATIHLRKTGLYRVDSDPSQLRVFRGEVDVEANGKTLDVKEGKLVSLDGEMAVAKFDTKVTDPLDRWSARRGEYVAMANVSAAKSLHDSGAFLGSSMWAWNPYFGMFTFIPYNGSYWSPYGYRFWSPYSVYQVYAPRPVYNPSYGGGGGYNASLGYSTMPQTSTGYSGTMASSASSAGSSGASHGTSTAPAGGASEGVSRGGSSSSSGRR